MGRSWPVVIGSALLAVTLFWSEGQAAPGTPPSALGTLPAMNAPSLAPSGCDTLLARLDAYGSLVRQNDDNVVQYLADLGQIIRVWHGQLSPLEGRNVFIEKGSFDPIRNTGDNVSASSVTVKKNADELAMLLKEVMTELPGCLK
ncbi:MAG: hypothetical protein IT288_11390 [Bdellovibrionales bacterium]|nr:hypothetical protein [Bdellovibrionales bacterium]